MIEYTKEDIIIFSDDERLKDAIGKECYFSNYPNYIITHINEDNCSLSKLKEIEIGYKYPFFNTEGRSYECIIIKKEEPKEYIPFESADEFLNAYENSKYNVINVTTEKKLISCGGIWLKSKCEADWITQCTELAVNGIILRLSHEFILWKELLDGYRFLDGTPCGKLKENTNDSI